MVLGGRRTASCIAHLGGMGVTSVWLAFRVLGLRQHGQGTHYPSRSGTKEAKLNRSQHQERPQQAGHRSPDSGDHHPTRRSRLTRHRSVHRKFLELEDSLIFIGGENPGTQQCPLEEIAISAPNPGSGSGVARAWEKAGSVRLHLGERSTVCQQICKRSRLMAGGCHIPSEPA